MKPQPFSIVDPQLINSCYSWGRKWFLVIPNIGGIIGAIVSARATSMGMYISGFCIGGIGFGSQGLFLAVISEVLPREYRSWSQAAANGVNALGSIFALSIGGYLIKSSREGFRTYFYICAGIYAIATLMLALLYNPIPRELQATLTMKQKITSLDWIGYIFLATGTVLFCLGLTWAQNPYRWTNPHVLVPLLVGVMLLCILAVYAWRFRKDGLFHHSLFCDRNYVISLIAIFIEGMSYMAAGIYFPASLSVVQAGKMSAYRQALCYMVGFCAFGVCSFATGLYIYKRKTVRITGMLTFVMMLVFFIVMSTVTVKTSEANFWGYILFYGMGIGLAFVTFVTSAQFATKPELIAVTTGLLISVRSLGGSIGVAIFNAISASGYGANVLPKVTKAVLPLGLPDQNITPLIDALGTANMTLINSIPGVTPQIVSAAGLGIRQAHVLGYRNVFICGGAFSVVGIISAYPHNRFPNYELTLIQLLLFCTIQPQSSMRKSMRLSRSRPAKTSKPSRLPNNTSKMRKPELWLAALSCDSQRSRFQDNPPGRRLNCMRCC